MDTANVYEIRVEGHLSECWADWFTGLSIRILPEGETVLHGTLRDQSALFGVLNQLQALHLVLISVRRCSA